MGFMLAMIFVAVVVAYDIWRRCQQPRWARERAERWEAFQNRSKRSD